MPRYVLSEGTSNKFWEIKLAGSSFTTTYGRIGTKGKSTTKDYPSAEKAKQEYEKLIASKVKKGYEKVLKMPAAKPIAKPTKAKGAAKSTERATRKGTAKPTKAKGAAKSTERATGKGTAKSTKRVAKPTQRAAKSATRESASISGGPRYELVEGTSKKFWEIVLDGKSLTTTYGRIGTSGKSTTKSFGSAAEARKERDKLVAQKTKKGYALVSGGTGPGARAKSNPELEAAILEDPQNPEAYLVYADWLQTQGDPRGELIIVQHALLAKPKDKKLRKAEAKLLADHGEHFVPPMLAAMLAKPKPPRGWRVDGSFCAVEWYCGFMKSATLGREAEDEDHPHKLEDLVSELFAHPSARFLQELTIGAIGIFAEYDYSNVTAALVSARPTSLRTFYMAEFVMEDSELSWSHLGNLGKLWKAMPNLEHLTLRGGTMILGTLDLPKLKSFRVVTGGLDAASIKSIVNARWPELESLHIYFGDSNYGAAGNLKKIAPILAAKGLGKLRHLGLMNAEFTNEICKALPSSKILPQLETLDLSLGTMDDDGARAIAESARAFAHLLEIQLDQNFISPAGVKLLDSAHLTEITARQKTPDVWDGESHRYVSVGE